MIENVIMYFLTFFSCVTLWKQEQLLLAILALYFIILLYFHKFDQNVIFYGLFMGLIFSIVEYICIKYFEMWKYQSTQALPLCLPVLWAIVALFMLDFIATMTTK